MLNILVPTDFSDLSKVAVKYAVRMANKMDGTVTLLHVISNIVQPTTARIQARAKVLEKELLQAAQEDINEMAANVAKEYKSKKPIQPKVLMGESFTDILIKFAKKSKTDIIVMGTRGASGMKKIVVGSNTSAIIEKCNIPVLAIPEGASFTALKNLVLATDLTAFENEIKKLTPILKAFDPALHIFHIVPNDKNVDALGAYAKDVLKKNEFRRSTVTIHVGKDVSTAIDSFVAGSNNDVLAMFSHDYGFFDQVFNRSLTKKMAFQSTVPLLAFKR